MELWKNFYLVDINNMGKARDLVEQKYKEDLQKADLEDQIITEVPKPDLINIRNFSGTIGDIQYGTFCNFLDLDSLNELVGHLPPIPMKLVCQTFVTAEYADSILIDKNNLCERWCISPLLLEIEATYLRVKWVTRLSVGLVYVQGFVKIKSIGNHFSLLSKLQPKLQHKFVMDENIIVAQIEEPLFWNMGDKITIFFTNTQSWEPSYVAKTIVNHLKNLVKC